MITGVVLQASFDLEASSLEIQMASNCYNRIKAGTHEKISPVTGLVAGTSPGCTVYAMRRVAGTSLFTETSFTQSNSNPHKVT